ncbi:hypothetical protein [Microbispora sp. CA-102843]|uniref:hypothetical protein n=1 Tax=Microbispora sp. CA-102843 TaxID=3239952 RepID=UPI003D8DAB45
MGLSVGFSVAVGLGWLLAVESGLGETLTETVAFGLPCGVAVAVGALLAVGAVEPLSAGAGAVAVGALLAVGAGAP